VPAARDLDPGASPAHFSGQVRHARHRRDDPGELGPWCCECLDGERMRVWLPADGEFAVACDEAFPNMNGWSQVYRDSGPGRALTRDGSRTGQSRTRSGYPPDLGTLAVPLAPTADYARALFKAWSSRAMRTKVEQSSRALTGRPSSTANHVVLAVRRGCAARLYRGQGDAWPAVAPSRAGRAAAVKVHVIPSSRRAYRLLGRSPSPGCGRRRTALCISRPDRRDNQENL